MKSSKPQKMPFLTHKRCRVCGIWLPKENAYKVFRCPCCHGRLAGRPRLNSNRRKYLPQNSEKPIYKHGDLVG